MNDKQPGSEKRPSAFARTFTSLILYRDYRLVWMGSWTEHMGEWMESTALLWLLWKMTESPLLSTLMVSARFLPLIIFAPIGGIVADRMNRRKLLIYTLLASAVLSLVLALLVHTGLIRWWHILLSQAFTGMITGFNHPARHTLVPNLVAKEHYLNAITLDSGTVMASRILGTPLAGFIISVAGTTPVLGLKAVGALLAIVWLRFVHAPETPGEARKRTPLRNFVEGVQFVGQNKGVLTQILLYLVPYFITNTYTALLPYFATKIFHVGPSLYGIMNAAPGAGALIAMVVLAYLVNFPRRGLVLLLAGISLGVFLILYALSPFYILSLFLLVVIGGCNTTFMTLNNTLIQTMITDQVRGRV
ncbi:MAG: MFS transporter, partial [Desulfobacterales bacterium]|nr:MFS transporter [Desulfobacterales bacterium]